MKDITRIKIANILAASRFWLPIIMFYYQSRGLSTDQTFTLLSYYSLMIVLLEYPTGVVSDHYSHKVSLILGYLAVATSLFLLSFSGGYLYYFFALGVMALGTSLVTGSDTALLSDCTKDINKHLSDVTFYHLIWASLTITIGGFLGNISLTLPIFLSGICFVIGALLISGVKGKKHNKMPGNVFSTAKEGFKQVKASNHLLYFVIISGLTFAYFRNYKWFYSFLFQELDFSISLWGVLISLGAIAILVGNRIFAKFSSKRITPFLFILSLAFLLMSPINPVVSLVGYMLIHVLNGYISMVADIEINETVDGRYRASVLSLRSLFVRLLSSGYLIIWGQLIDNFPLRIFFIANAIFLGMVGVGSYLKKYLKKLK